MRKLITIFVLFTATVFAAVPFQKTNDVIRFGSGTGSVDPIEFFFNVGDGVSNPKLLVDKTEKKVTVSTDLNVDGNALTLGDGTATAKQINIARGGSNPYLKWDETASSWVFSNDGSLEKKIGSGTGAGTGVNFLSNPSFEDPGTPVLDWTCVGATVTQETHTNGREGNDKFLRINASASGQYCESNLFTVSSDVNGQCIAEFKYNQGDNAFNYQILDNLSVVKSEGSVSDLTSFLKAPAITFDCADGDQFKLRLTSTAAGILDADEAKAGTGELQAIGKQPHFVGSIQWVPTPACHWTFVTSATYADFPADLECDDNPRVLTGDIQDSGAGQLLQFTLPNVKKGHYKIFLIGSIYKDNTNSGGSLYRMTDGTNNSSASTVFANGAQSTAPLAAYEFDYGADTGPVTFKLQAASSLASTAAVYGIETDTKFSVYYYPSSNETQEAWTPEQADFYVDVSIGGVNYTYVNTLGTEREVNSTGFDMVINEGSAKIPCDGVNPPVGLNCGAQAESVGVVFNAPRAGFYKACASFHSGSAAAVNHRLVETPTNAQTILQVGKESSGVAALAPFSSKICGRFYFGSIGEKAIRLFYDSTSGGTLYADRDPNTFGRDINITVEMVGHNVSRPIIQNMVDTSVGSGVRVEACSVNNNGTATVDSATGLCESWVQSVARGVAGQVTITPIGGIFPNGVVCQCNINDVDSRICSFTSGFSTPIVVRTNTIAGAGEDRDFNISCKGKR